MGMVEDTTEAMRLLREQFPDVQLAYGVPFGGRPEAS